jgi:hypothetical protein
MILLQASPPQVSPLDWDLALKAVGTLLSIALGFLQLRQFLQALRTSLKTDLEILNLLGPDHPQYESIRGAIDRSLERRFGTPMSSRWQERLGPLRRASVRAFAGLALFYGGYLLLRWQWSGLAFWFFIVALSFVAQAVFEITERDYVLPGPHERRQDAPVQPIKRSRTAEDSSRSP